MVVLSAWSAMWNNPIAIQSNPQKAAFGSPFAVIVAAAVVRQPYSPIRVGLSH